MPVTATITPMDGYLLIKSSGEMATVEDGVEYIEAQVAAARRAGMRRLLVDDRDMAVLLDYGEILALAEYWEQNELPLMGLRAASLPPPSAPEGQQAYETAAGNRSIVFKTFFDEQGALDWLMKR